MEDQRSLTDDGYLNEKHMAVVERALLALSESRRKLRVSAEELRTDGAEQHLVDALIAADAETESVYRRLFQGTYFHVSEEQMASAGEQVKDESKVKRASTKKEAVDPTESGEEMRLFRGDEAHDTVKK